LGAFDDRDGNYYEAMWQRAIAADPTHVSVTSFNEWGEGTQIEAARAIDPVEGFSKQYKDYGEAGPYKYLHITQRFATILKTSGKSIHHLQSEHHERSVRQAAGLPPIDDDEEYPTVPIQAADIDSSPEFSDEVYGEEEDASEDEGDEYRGEILDTQEEGVESLNEEDASEEVVDRLDAGDEQEIPTEVLKQDESTDYVVASNHTDDTEL
jgi:hypothetical protein